MISRKPLNLWALGDLQTLRLMFLAIVRYTAVLITAQSDRILQLWIDFAYLYELSQQFTTRIAKLQDALTGHDCLDIVHHARSRALSRHCNIPADKPLPSPAVCGSRAMASGSISDWRVFAAHGQGSFLALRDRIEGCLVRSVRPVGSPQLIEGLFTYICIVHCLQNQQRTVIVSDSPTQIYRRCRVGVMRTVSPRTKYSIVNHRARRN